MLNISVHKIIAPIIQAFLATSTVVLCVIVGMDDRMAMH